MKENMKENIEYITFKFNNTILNNIDNNDKILYNYIKQILYDKSHIPYIESIIELYMSYDTYKTDNNYDMEIHVNSVYLAIIYLYYHLTILDSHDNDLLEANSYFEYKYENIDIEHYYYMSDEDFILFTRKYEKTLHINSIYIEEFNRIYIDIVTSNNIYISQIRRRLLGMNIDNEPIIGSVELIN